MIGFLKSAMLAVLALGLAMISMAFASKLDPKWSVARKEANQLGDAAKAGQVDAYQTLVNKAAISDAPAAHNIGWLYKTGRPGETANFVKACGWYGKAAKLAYPPSMHEHALCLFALASKANGDTARTKLLQQAYQALLGASKGGWTKSSIYMSKKVLNFPRPSNKDFGLASVVIGYGLASNPTHQEKVTLSYFKGMRAIYAPGSGSYAYRTGRDALRFADKNGHQQAGKALPALYTKWVRSLIKSMTAWSPPEQSGLSCYRKKLANSSDKMATAVECGSLDRRKMKRLERLKSNSKTLQYDVSGQEKAELKLAIDRLNNRSAQFRADSQELADIFIQNLPK